MDIDRRVDGMDVGMVDRLLIRCFFYLCTSNPFLELGVHLSA